MEIDDDVLEAARRLAKAEGKSLSQIVSLGDLAPQLQEKLVESFPVFSVSPRAKPLTLKMVHRALEARGLTKN